MASFLFDKIGYRENHRKHFCRNQATEIWYGTLQEYHRIGKAKKTDAAMEELFELCNLAYSITLTFRGSKTEYEWEQDPGQLAISMMNDGKQIEVVGITGQSPNDAANSKVAFVVFGGVVRGDKTTGLLRDGKNCLMPTSVVKGSLCGLAIPNIK
jgi:hypothetical protein